MSLQKIFFSYSRIDGSDFALRLALDLKKAGFNVWIDQEDIRAGSEWDIEIEKALETCDCLLFIETEKSVTSNNVLDEVYYALEQHKKVIPLILRDSKTPFRLQRLQHINFDKDYHSGLGLLINELKGNKTDEVFQPEEGKSLAKVDKPFYKRHAGLILAIAALLIIAIVIFIYTEKNKNAIHGANDKIVNSDDTIPGSKEPITVEPTTAPGQNAGNSLKRSQKEVSMQGRSKETGVQSKSKEVNGPGGKIVNLNETFTGEWQLTGVEPNAQSWKGYLNIEAIDEEKVKIKSYIQFYYFKANDTSFLSIFNAFAGCSACKLYTRMKLTAEDIAVASQTYTILKEDQPGNGKAGDTIARVGSNKSIRASVTLQLTGTNSAVIKVEKPVPTELSNGLVLKPFVYSFRFKKTDY